MRSWSDDDDDDARAHSLSSTNPAILQLDGHASRLTLATMNLLLAYNILAFIIPSHTSTIHQAADNGLQALTQRLYEKEVGGACMHR